jgi:hypothetical protein
MAAIAGCSGEDESTAEAEEEEEEDEEAAEENEEVVVTYRFSMGGAGQAADVAKAFVEYVEGTYVEGVIPGYEYVGPVAELLNSASSGASEGSRGGTPL